MLDTSAYSAFMRGQAEVKLALQRAEEIFVNPIVLGELLAGFVRGKRRQKNEGELRRFLASPRVHVLTLDGDTADRYAVIHESLWRARIRLPSNDLWIVATAMQHGLRVLTMDAQYQRVSQVIVDYIEPS
jgi:tRNA(fMet)-specific endonuclease VapC